MVPESSHLDGCKFEPVPYYFFGDDIFPLKTWLLRPFARVKLSIMQLTYSE